MAMKKKSASPETTMPAEKKADSPVASIKGVDRKLQCRGFQFEIGKTYTVTSDVKACENGFHACPAEEHPLSVFEYYAPATSRYFEVIQDGASDREGTKLASASITIGVEISLGDLAARAVKWVFDRAIWKDAPNVSGDNEAATASGTQGAATASGYQGAATASGTQGAATASGTQGAATASGTQGAATASGTQGAATASGYAGKAKGTEGSALFLVERDDNYKIIEVWAGIVGRDGVKADTFYRLADGVIVECEAESD
jgi:hypothetical protein